MWTCIRGEKVPSWVQRTKTSLLGTPAYPAMSCPQSEIPDMAAFCPARITDGSPSSKSKLP